MPTPCGWSACTTPRPRPVAEAALAARYGLPTVPFVARRTPKTGPGSLVGNQELLDRLFAELDTDKGGLQLLADHGLDFEHPHHVAGFERRARARHAASAALGHAVR